MEKKLAVYGKKPLLNMSIGGGERTAAGDEGAWGEGGEEDRVDG